MGKHHFSSMDRKEIESIIPQKIVLLGVKHSGKSSIGRYLSEILNWPFRDLDDCIETQTQALMGFSVREFFRVEGKSKFFAIEKDCLETFISNRPAPWILATGGGIIENELAIKLMPGNALKVFLNNSPEELFKRIQKKGLPPFLSTDNPYKTFVKLFESRTANYKAIADVIVNLDNSTKDHSTEKVILAIKEYLNAR
jgi:shikimate kinase